MAATPITDDKLRTHRVVLGPNYTKNEESASAEPFGKRQAVDEFLRVIPFEAFAGDATEPLLITRPEATEPLSAYLPDSTVATEGAGWLLQGAKLSFSGSPGSELLLTLEVGDLEYEAFRFRRLAVWADVDDELLADPATRARIEDLLRTAARRKLGRDLINGLGDPSAETDPVLAGLAKYYEKAGTFATDPQVFKAANSSATPTDLRKLIRLVTPSDVDGLGAGPNAVLASRRAWDLLVKAQGMSEPPLVTWHPDPLSPGELRAFAWGVPIYLAPIREDEDTAATTAPATSSPVTYDGTSIYAARLGGPSGVRVLYAPSAKGTPDAYGFQMGERKGESVGTTKLYCEGTFCLFVPEHEAVARMFAFDLSSV